MDVTDAALQVSGVSHRYGRRPALHDVTLTLPVGVTGLLGPNGAGKSTLMKLLATATPLRAGEVRFGDLVLGASPVTEIRRLIGYLPQKFELMEWSSVRRNVDYAAWAHGLSGDAQRTGVDAVLEAVGLTDRSHTRARSLSGGMRQRLGLACALVHRPAVAILDEPTVGLDPVQRGELRRLIAELGEHSVVLISTHLVEDLAASAEQVVVLHEGRVRFRGSVDDLRALGETYPNPHTSVLEAGYELSLQEAQ
ncbi:MAG: ATP-binding cassette domain-containing protein [Propionicimonas sp.]|uniref:ATP-binding cassette domain-containing protein n=1 Tax=Propionicimonas sp. TaxID=1955623 RepID=UPI002B1F686D|nr:ATP-binding cassette domain-containing protein [Propionicimonas sp.]MEA4945363.1 ATP-binding cassette domain-containing protein [Propionicimonas sp.]MEA5053612.1 ATP-binding cassette domain-containing protein [Propionicimonas sp.]MEA5118484.1 ATP-binding cassette domain-containing protein [Propionicimonas sp.]